MTDILGKIKSVVPVGKSFAKVILYLLYHNPLLVKLFGIEENVSFTLAKQRIM